MNKSSILILLLLIFNQLIFAQDKFWILFKDKNGSTFNPETYFDIKAIERRIMAGIPLYDSTDFPVNKKYIEKILPYINEFGYESRWLNAISVYTDEKRIFEIQKLPFVNEVIPISLKIHITSDDYDTNLSESDKKILFNQIERMKGSLFIKNKITGKGTRIAVFDAGFPDVNQIPVFEHLVKNKKILKTYDFVKKNDNVNTGHKHGTMVLSCIAGYIEQKHLGLATDAEFLLARVEVDKESAAEEDFWIAAIEWADKNGANIVNSSLGYTYRKYFAFEMDGKTSLASKAATIAAKKGILVINAMGNEGDKEWKILATPADADSVLSVGGINPLTDYHASFSSFGPTADKRMKPNVVAYAQAIVADDIKLSRQKGTSFAAPLITGFAACVWQMNRNFSNMNLKKEIEKSGDLYPYFDYAHGFGVPQASYFFNSANNDSLPKQTFSIHKKKDIVSFLVYNKFIETKNANKSNYLFVHIENEKGIIERYWLIDVYNSMALSFSIKNFQTNSVLMAHYKGYTIRIKLKEIKE